MQTTKPVWQPRVNYRQIIRLIPLNFLFLSEWGERKLRERELRFDKEASSNSISSSKAITGLNNLMHFNLGLYSSVFVLAPYALQPCDCSTQNDQGICVSKEGMINVWTKKCINNGLVTSFYRYKWPLFWNSLMVAVS